VNAANDLDWFEDKLELPGVVVELKNPGDEIARDERVQAYIRDRLQPAAEALDRIKNVFCAATTPTPLDGYIAARAAYAYELAQSGKSAEEIAMLLMPTPAQIKTDLMTRIGGR
jgi:hypothetical protein